MVIKKIKIKINAKKNLALLICIGLIGGPKVVVPNTFANIVVPAISNEAEIINKTDVTVFCFISFDISFYYFRDWCVEYFYSNKSGDNSYSN